MILPCCMLQGRLEHIDLLQADMSSEVSIAMQCHRKQWVEVAMRIKKQTANRAMGTDAAVIAVCRHQPVESKLLGVYRVY